MTASVDPCSACPWGAVHAGKRHTGGWYTKANRARLWRGLRRGESMSCHPTDPQVEISARAQEQGSRPAPDHAKLRECMGALILQQREFMYCQEDYSGDVALYRRQRPFGLTKDGLRVLVARFVLGGTPLGGRELPRPNLNDTAIQYDAVGTWEKK